jgi:hypothetical protein
MSSVTETPVANPMMAAFLQMLSSMSVEDKKAMMSAMKATLPPEPEPAAPVTKKGKKVAAPPSEQMEGAPDASEYRLKTEEIDHTVCLARKINGSERSKIREWKPIIYRELQCGKAVKEDGLCTLCKVKSDCYTGSEGTWWGLVTEEPPEWMHMLGTRWAEERQPRWQGPSTSAAASEASEESESIVSSASGTSSQKLTLAAQREADRIRRLAEKEEQKAAEFREKEAAKAELKAAKEAEKAEMKKAKEAEKLALKAQKEAEKAALKAEKEAEKLALKAQKEAEKAALKAQKEAEKPTKAAPKTAAPKTAPKTAPKAVGGAGAASPPPAVAVTSQEPETADLIIRMYGDDMDFYALKQTDGEFYAYKYDQASESVGECVGKALLDGSNDMEITGIDTSVKV